MPTRSTRTETLPPFGVNFSAFREIDGPDLELELAGDDSRAVEDVLDPLGEEELAVSEGETAAGRS